MKKLLLLFVSCIVACTCIAATPDNPAGMRYVRTDLHLVAGSGTWTETTELRLLANGSYLGLISENRPMFGAAQRSSYRIPGNGRWSYRKIDATRSELALNGVINQLVFETDEAGRVPLNEAWSRRFRFTSYDEGTPFLNCSNRCFIRAATSAFTGFVIADANRARVLVRAVGPSLEQFGVRDGLRRPKLDVYRAGTNALVATNTGWGNRVGLAEANARVGAFALMQDSLDSALFWSLDKGAYVVEVSSTDPDDSGQVLIEVYMLP